ncbi:AI-2E family transporter [Aestuariibius sp. 2305UL40-4]|uniref:AI-2E family transporter n=1 Tax=Aestuariibius violaceus TaxID=3234132 RepID=UPI00345EA134
MPSRDHVPTLLLILTAIAVASAFRIASEIFAPTVLALVVGVVIAPLAGRMTRSGIPEAASAFLTLVLFLSLLGGLFAALSPIAQLAIQSAPDVWREMQTFFAEFQRAARGLDEVAGDVAAAVGSDGSSDEGSLTIPTLTDLVSYAPTIAGQLLIFVGTLYFFLLGRRSIYGSACAIFASLDKSILINAERDVSRYFLTITIIYACFATIVTGYLHLIGMPAALLWGGLAFLLNFILYLGPIVLACSLLIAGIVAFDGFYAILPAAGYLLMNMTEGQFVTPQLVGRSMQINPLLVFMSLVFWLWLWGPIGAIIAIPILVWTRALRQERAERPAKAVAEPAQNAA